MDMSFVNRIKETDRIQKALQPGKSKLIMIYGRRRCGKSTLIRHLLLKKDVYFMADQSESSIQRSLLARAISEKIEGFDQVTYPSWESLFTSLNSVLNEQITICIDEFPYLVKNSHELPSVLQKLIDAQKNSKYHMILCGSSQQMMHGIVTDSSEPLYGRADEIIKLQPMTAYWLQQSISCDPVSAVQEFSVWGGVPRYWELRKEKSEFETAIKDIILDQHSVLHDEPLRLFLDDMRESVQAYSLLSVIGSGCNRLSEIAGRLEKPATQLSRPIDNLMGLGYLKRDIPYGESPRSSKKSLYRISDPFMNFYFSFVVPNASRLEAGFTNRVYNEIIKKIPQYVAHTWESLCRAAIPYIEIGGNTFNSANRWWGINSKGEPMEIDIVAESIDKKNILVGECKWSDKNDINRILHELEYKSKLLPFVEKKKIIRVLFLKESKNSSYDIYTPEKVIKLLK